MTEITLVFLEEEITLAGAFGLGFLVTPTLGWLGFMCPHINNSHGQPCHKRHRSSTLKFTFQTLLVPHISCCYYGA
jgi:hypothetical protein